MSNPEETPTATPMSRRFRGYLPVVVDVETTGSWAAGDRITEIGAVKVRNHQVVDEWHSLLNPQRTIRQE
jgi:DNA polymerase III epsilon subunit-like protein